MKVTVSIITYNHEKYIAEAIESALMQRVHFDYEVVIGEDESEDNTRGIVTEYKRRYPEKIKLLLNDRKNVICIDGRPTGRWNFINNFKHATGEYIALLEGDDYWTSPNKLQEQVDFLDRHPECPMCFHNACILRPDQSQADYMKQWFRVEIKPYYTLEDLLLENFIPTCSVMLRKKAIKRFPSEFFTIVAGDWLLHIMCAQVGRLGYIDKAWGVRRLHEGGVISMQSVKKKLMINIKCLRTINSYLDFRYDDVLRSVTSQRFYELARQYESSGEVLNARKCLAKSIAKSPFNSRVSGKDLANIALRLYLPSIYNAIVSLWHAAGRGRVGQEKWNVSE